MSSSFPFVTCICPTFRRPALLANSVACFLMQDYPADRREMLILDDAGQFFTKDYEVDNTRVTLISRKKRIASLTEKFNLLAGLADGEIILVWEDDDMYLPWHVSSHVAAMSDDSPCCTKPSVVLSTYGGRLQEEDSTGRFHASLGMNRAALDAVGGWPETQRGDFDQILMANLKEFTVDSLDKAKGPSYVFRWEDTGSYHGQAFMSGPEDEGWYERAGQESSDTSPASKILRPKFDDKTLHVWKEKVPR